MNYQNIKNHPEKISNIEPFISQYNWKSIDFTAHQEDQKNIEQEGWENKKKKAVFIQNTQIMSLKNMKDYVINMITVM